MKRIPFIYRIAFTFIVRPRLVSLRISGCESIPSTKHHLLLIGLSTVDQPAGVLEELFTSTRVDFRGPNGRGSEKE